ncbi:MAG: hypothetical protein IJ147_08930 [Lachnospiraceae bacterium]|nr:hypothetical protein [Lachnospiraceae bacterium]
MQKMIGMIIVLVLILAIVLTIVISVYKAYRKVHDTVTSYSQAFFGTDNPIEGMKKAELESASTPKSVSSATNLYLPQIMKDFPEFHYDEMKTRAENVLTSYLQSIDNRNSSILTEGMSELRENLDLRIQMLKDQNMQEHFERIHIHRTEINQYRKNKGRCSVVLQSSVEYIHYREQNGQVTSGHTDMKEQARYNIELVYIQDRDFVENSADSGLALNCPNCGGPLPKLGAKKCIYCDTPIIEFNLRVWNFSSVKES